MLLLLFMLLIAGLLIGNLYAGAFASVLTVPQFVDLFTKYFCYLHHPADIENRCNKLKYSQVRVTNRYGRGFSRQPVGMG